MTVRRSAHYVSTLVYLNEPQLMHLKAHKTHVIALAIPSPAERADFIAASVSKKSWQSYVDGTVDLRYLFTYAERSIYKFDLMKVKDNRVILLPWEGTVPEKFLPESRFFSRSHTEDDSDEDVDAPGEENLLVDGEWDMPDFGAFYGRYADVYYFLASANEIEDENVSIANRKSIMNAYRDKAFRGGFSYVHFYNALAANRTRGERISIDKIKYESPGYIRIHGSKLAFSEVRSLINRFLENRPRIKEVYDEMYRYMSQARLLTSAGEDFSSQNAFSEPLQRRSSILAEMLGVPNQATILRIVDSNMLVYTKIVMSFYRRMDETSKFFAQGRMNFQD